MVLKVVIDHEGRAERPQSEEESAERDLQRISIHAAIISIRAPTINDKEEQGRGERGPEPPTSSAAARAPSRTCSPPHEGA